MTDSFAWQKHLKPVCHLPESTGLSEAWQTMQQNQISFALVGNQTLISAEQLAYSDKTDDLTLVDFFDPLPPKLTLDAEWESLSWEQLNTLTEAIEYTGAPGVLIDQGDEIQGVLSAETLSNAIPPGMLRVSKGGTGGTSTTGFRIYMCDQCGSIRIPASGGAAPPNCNKNIAHGPMRLEQ